MSSTKKCVHCGKKFYSENGVRYCSNQCREQHIKLREKLRRKHYLYHKTCKYCGKSFDSPTSNRVYCCDGCKKQAEITKRLENKETAICIVCGKPFTRYNAKQIICSPECSAERAKQLYRGAGTGRKYKGHCLRCGETFTTKNKCQVYCPACRGETAEQQNADDGKEHLYCKNPHCSWLKPCGEIGFCMLPGGCLQYRRAQK